MAPGLTGGSFWQAGDLVLRLTATGTGRQLTVARVPDGSGLAEGMVLFQGRRNGQSYEGAVFDPLAACDGVPDLAARGDIRGETRVVLRARNLPDCASDLFREDMVLVFLGKAEGEPPAVAPAQTAADATVATVDAAADAEGAENAADPAPAPQMPEPAAAGAVQAEGDDATAKAATTEAAPAEAAPAETAPAALAAGDAGADEAAPVAAAQTAQPWQVPKAACVAKGAAQGLSIAACQGMMAGLRLAEGADPAAEADRRALLALSGGATDLNRAVDAACYGAAQIRDHEAGLVLAQSKAGLAEGLRPLCLEMIAAANKVPAAARLATVATPAGAIAADIWTLDADGGSCKGKDVLRLTSLGLFQGRFGAETAVTNATVSAFADDGARLSARITIHSEILTAPDVILQIAAERAAGGLKLVIDRQRVTPQSRYSSAPEYEIDRISGTYFACRG